MTSKAMVAHPTRHIQVAPWVRKVAPYAVAAVVIGPGRATPENCRAAADGGFGCHAFSAAVPWVLMVLVLGLGLSVLAWALFTALPRWAAAAGEQATVARARARRVDAPTGVLPTVPGVAIVPAALDGQGLARVEDALRADGDLVIVELAAASRLSADTARSVVRALTVAAELDVRVVFVAARAQTRQALSRLEVPGGVRLAASTDAVLEWAAAAVPSPLSAAAVAA